MTAAKLVTGATLAASGLWAIWVTHGEFGLIPGQMPILLGIAVITLGFYRPPDHLIVRRVLVTAVVGVGLMAVVSSVPEITSQSHVRLRTLLDAVTGGLVLTYGLLEVFSFRTWTDRTLRYSK